MAASRRWRSGDWWRGAAAMAIGSALTAGWLVGTTEARPGAELTSWVTVSILRNADTGGNSPFVVITRLWLADAEVQQVIATITGSQPWEIVTTSFTRESANDWFADIGAATLNQLKSFASGTWQLEILGDRVRNAEFQLDLSALSGSDLPPTPSITQPAAFATNVPRNVQFLWTNPWAPGLPDQLEIYEHSANGCGPSVTQRLRSVDSTIQVDATSWQPPSPLGPAANQFRVTSTRLAHASQATISQLKNTVGSVNWGSAPGTPKGYPGGTPLLLIGSQRSTTFEVLGPAAGDLNGDGVVDGADLGVLLGNWG